MGISRCLPKCTATTVGKTRSALLSPKVGSVFGMVVTECFVPQAVEPLSGLAKVTSDLTKPHQDGQGFTAAIDVAKCLDQSDFATNLHM